MTTKAMWKTPLACIVFCLVLSVLSHKAHATHCTPIDLYFTKMTVTPTTVLPGQNVTISYTVYNSAGCSTASSFITRFFFSTDATIDANTDTSMGGDRTLSLSSRASSSGTVTLKVPLTAIPGTRYIGGFADATFKISEGNETNNGRGAAVTVVVTDPDLQVNSVVTPLSGNDVPQGGLLQSKVTLYNGGKAFTTDFKVDYYYCTGSTAATCSTTKLGTDTITKDFNIGETYTYTSTSLTLPATAATGTRYIRVVVDPDNQLKEYKEDNNDKFDSINVLPPRADVRIKTFSVTPVSVFSSIQFTVTYQLENIGSLPANEITFRLYFSKDTTINTSDTYLQHERTLSIPAGQSTQTFQAVITTPATLPIGPGYVGGFADYSNAVAESNENNNTANSPLTVTQTIDLQAIKIKPSAAVSVVGKQASFDYEIKNTGKGVLNSYKVGFYYSATSTITTSSTLLKVETLTLLPPGVTEFGSVTITLPSNITPGTGYVGMIIDPNNEISEVSKQNNSANTSAIFATDKDGDGYAHLPGCPSSVPDCDCDDNDKTINPKAAEICDGKDNDCDGKIEQNLTRSCYTGAAGTEKQSPCKTGTQTCANGSYGACVGEIIPKQEVCDKVDNDCNGQVDDGINCTPEPKPEPKPEPVIDTQDAGPGPERPNICTPACKSDEMCVNGQCVAMPPKEEENTPEETTTEETNNADGEPLTETKTESTTEPKPEPTPEPKKEASTGNDNKEPTKESKTTDATTQDQTTVVKDEQNNTEQVEGTEQSQTQDTPGDAGCGCTSTPSGPWSVVFLVLAVAFSMRRRTQRQP
jgi:MYXO-CTERM domain-containing protein